MQSANHGQGHNAPSRGAIRAFYDRIGRIEDWWAPFGDRAIDAMIANGAFDQAHSVCEIGCGTGRLARRLLGDHLPPDCRYVGFDLSTTMVDRATRRLAPWADRAEVRLADAVPAIPMEDGACDRLVATYVVEIFDDEEARALLTDAHRVLSPGGLACLTSLAQGTTGASRMFCALWGRVHRWRPALVGGCHPIDMAARLDPDAWEITFRQTTVRWSVPCEAVIARRI